MISLKRLALCFVLSALAVGPLYIAACSDDGESTGDQRSGGSATDGPFSNRPQPCQELIAACHPKDDGTPGAINDCHVKLGHLGTAEECQAGIDRGCLDTCGKAPLVEAGVNCDTVCGDLFTCTQNVPGSCPGITEEKKGGFIAGCMSGCASFPPGAVDPNDCPGTIDRLRRSPGGFKAACEGTGGGH